MAKKSQHPPASKRGRNKDQDFSETPVRASSDPIHDEIVEAMNPEVSRTTPNVVTGPGGRTGGSGGWTGPVTDDRQLTEDTHGGNLRAGRTGGASGGDVRGAGRGPAIGETHEPDDDGSLHFGSPDETRAALEGRIALENTRRMHP